MKIINLKFLLLLTVLFSIFAFNNEVFAFEIQRWTQNNGAKVILVERHENPIIDINVAFDAGSRRENPKQLGVADMTNGLLDSGTQFNQEDVLKQKINDLAVDISSYGSTEEGGIKIRSLTQPDVLNPAIILANQMLTVPSFDGKVLQREKKRAIAGLQQGLTQPSFIAARTLTQLSYPNHPYGFSAKETPESIAAINRNQLIQFHQDHYLADQATVAIVGDINKAEATKIVDRLLKGLPSNQKSFQTHDIEAVTIQKGQSTHISNPAKQTHILLGMPLISRDDPDYYPLIVGNYILGGGGFDGRLMKVLRDQKGLTYGAYSMMSPMQQKGPFVISVATKQESANEALKATQEVITDFIENGPSNEELTQAKANIIGGFPLRFDSNAKLINYLSMMEFYQLPADFLENYPKKVKELTPEKIKDAWQRRVKLSDINTVIVGNE